MPKTPIPLPSTSFQVPAEGPCMARFARLPVTFTYRVRVSTVEDWDDRTGGASPAAESDVP